VAWRLVDSIHPLVQNVVLLNSVHPFAIHLWVTVIFSYPSVIS
jgi:hypothetical protein